MRKVLIDSDILRYSHGAISMRHPYLDGEFVPASSDYVCRQVDLVIKNTLKACGVEDYVCVLSGKGNFRTDVANQVVYKGNRNPNLTRPAHYGTIEKHIKDNHPFVEVDGYEADDWMGTTQYKDWKKSVYDELTKTYGETDPTALLTIIASRDKDLRTIQGWHYSWGCGKNQPEKPLYYICPTEALRMFMYQMLIGDSTDNIMGCGIRELRKWGFKRDENKEFILDENGDKIPNMVMRRKGVGDKEAKKLLDSCKTIRDMLEAITNEYISMFGEEDYGDIMLENARLLFIGQTNENLFEWSWLDKYLDLEVKTKETTSEEIF